MDRTQIKILVRNFDHQQKAIKHKQRVWKAISTIINTPKEKFMPKELL